MRTKKSLSEQLFESVNRSAGLTSVDEDENRKRMRYLFEAEDDEEKIEDEEEEEEENLENEEEEGMGDEDEMDLGDDEDELDLDAEDLEDAEIDPDDLDVDYEEGEDLEGGDEFEGDLDVDLEGMEDEEMGDFDMEGMEDVDDLLADEPPELETDMVGGDELDDSSDFTQFVTNQLIDFPVDDVEFIEENGARYVDARFGEKAVTFVLYTGEDGQPLLGMLYENEAYRIELPAEAVCDDGCVRDNFMPIDWIRDNLARLVDTAPTFECYRLKSRRSSCNETRKKTRRVKPMKESMNSAVCTLRAIKQGGESSVKNTPLGQPEKSRKNSVNDGAKGKSGAKEAPLGGGKIKWADKAGGGADMEKDRKKGKEGDGKRGIDVPTSSDKKKTM